MRAKCLLVGLLLLLPVDLLYGQGLPKTPWVDFDSLVTVDSTVFVRDTIEGYPYQAEHDSVVKEIQKAQSQVDGHVDYFAKNRYYVVTDSGEVEYSRYAHAISSSLPQGLFCILRFQFAWTGTAEKVTAWKCRSEPVPTQALRKMAERVRAEPDSLGGIPSPGFGVALPVFGPKPK